MCGGFIPLMMCHLVILRPDSVSRVTPPVGQSESKEIGKGKRERNLEWEGVKGGNNGRGRT